MTRTLAFLVRGLPVPQGALVRSPHGGLYHRDARRLEDWRHAIAAAAAGAIDGPPIEGPVSVSVDFVFPRPQSHYLPANSRRPEPELRPGAPVHHSGAPDVDKLLRALLDALTGVVIRDDGQVAITRASKLYETPERPVGCAVAVRSLGMR